ncbi:MAG: peptidylprolyl isomerase [Acidobacteria bacterium]|nr:peptidylprolyl isomerase [Acidobacteriota bacterium]
MPRHIVVLAGTLACLVSFSCGKSAPPNVAATVNSRPITYADVDKQFQSQFASAGEHPSDDQSQFQKLELLRTMIDSEIMVQRAEKASLVATDADVEAKLNELKAPYTQEEFQRQLQSRKMTVEDLKAQLRRDLSVQKLFNKEIGSHINISDKDIGEFYNANRASFNLIEPQIHMAQILVTPAPNPDVHNLKNDKAQNDEQAMKKIQNLLARIRQGEDFAQLAQAYSEDPASAQNGGDLGFIAESALERASPELRKTVLAIPPGQVSNILKTQEGYRILKVIAKEPAGQRELNDPRVQQTIRETLQNRKDQLLRGAYVEVARNEAKVVNYFAITISQSKDNK